MGAYLDRTIEHYMRFAAAADRRADAMEKQAAEERAAAAKARQRAEYLRGDTAAKGEKT